MGAFSAPHRMSDPLVLIVTLKGTPRGLPRGRHIPGRPRPVSITGKAKPYAQALERAARAVVLAVGYDKVLQAFGGRALSVSVLWQFPTACRDRWGKPHTYPPDFDNLAKLVLDCCQRAGALAGDDCRVSGGEMLKVWASAGLVAIRIEVAQAAGTSVGKTCRKDKLSAPPPWLL